MMAYDKQLKELYNDVRRRSNYLGRGWGSTSSWLYKRWIQSAF